jgi:hypothetical protein
MTGGKGNGLGGTENLRVKGTGFGSDLIQSAAPMSGRERNCKGSIRPGIRTEMAG